MSKADLATMSCTVARTIELVGDQWSQMIIHELFLGSNRFDQLERYTRISPHLLSQRLKRLESLQIVKRLTYSDHSKRFEYKLTEKGRDLWPVVIALKNWGDRWLEEGGEDKQIVLTHTTCGHETTPHLTCPKCGDPIDALTTKAEISSTMTAEREAFSAATLKKVQS